MKALSIALLGVSISVLMLVGCSAGGALPTVSSPAIRPAHPNHASSLHHRGGAAQENDCPIDSGGVSPGNVTC